MSWKLRATALTFAAVTLSACGNGADAPAEAPADAPATAPAATDEGAEDTAAAPECPPEEGAEERTTEFAAAPPMCIDPEAEYSATVTTDAGEFVIDLDAAQAPETVNNFVFLARNQYYDGIVFHRVIPGFMNQTGDPEGTGMGGPGYQFADELPEEGAYEVGSVAMANAGPNTNGSQFFIVTGDDGVNLPPDYSLFGQVSEGMDVVHAIEEDGTDTGAPETTHTMETVRITQN